LPLACESPVSQPDGVTDEIIAPGAEWSFNVIVILLLKSKSVFPKASTAFTVKVLFQGLL